MPKNFLKYTIIRGQSANYFKKNKPHCYSKLLCLNSFIYVNEQPLMYALITAFPSRRLIVCHLSVGEGNDTPLQYSCLENPGRLQSMGSLRVGHNWASSLSLFTFMHWRRNWQPTPVFLPGESQGRGAWWAAVYGVAQSRTDWSDLAAAAAASFGSLN